MAHIDAEHDQDGGHGAAVLLDSGPATSARSTRPAAQPIPLRPTQGAPEVGREPIWDKNNFGFWLTVCILISLVFSFVWRAFG